MYKRMPLLRLLSIAIRPWPNNAIPDFNKGKEEVFKEVNEAYQILSDEATKREYDQVRSNGTRYSGQNYRENYRPAADHPQDPRHSAENQWKSYQEYYNSRHQAYQ